MNRLTHALTAVALSIAAQHICAQAYPAKPIRVVVPFAAAGPADIQSRWLAARLTTDLGKQVLIDNRGGAGGIVGTQAVTGSPADGYTLLFASVGALTVAPYVVEKMPYNPKQDLTPVVRVVTAPCVLVTGPKARYGTLAELVSYAKANPGKLTYASAGSGTTTHLGPELLKREAHIDMLHVPYRGAAPAITDVLAGSADVILADAPVVLPYLTSNRLKAIAIATSARSPALPNVPTIAEAGYKNVLVSTWYGLVAPARTPREIVVKLNGAVNKVLSGADAKSFYGDQGVQINGGTPEEFGSFIAAETARWSTLAKAVGVKMD